MLLLIKLSSKIIFLNTAHLYVKSSFLVKATNSIGYSSMAPTGELPRQLCCRIADISFMN